MLKVPSSLTKSEKSQKPERCHPQRVTVVVAFPLSKGTGATALVAQGICVRPTHQLSAYVLNQGQDEHPR